MADVMDTLDKDGNYDAAVVDRVKGEVLSLCAQYPVYDFKD